MSNGNLQKTRLTESAVWEIIVKIGYYTHTHTHTLAQTLLEALWLCIYLGDCFILAEHILWALKLLVLDHFMKICTLSCFSDTGDGPHQIIHNMLVPLIYSLCL